MLRSPVRLSIVAAALCAAPTIAAAQQALENLETKLRAAPGAQAPPAAVPNAADAEPGYLGIIADDADTAGRGIRLLDVLPGGPAHLGGFRPGDILTSIDGMAVRSLDDVAGILSQYGVGQKVAFVAIRGIEAVRVDVVLGKRPPPEARRFPQFGRVPEQPIVVEPPAAAPGATPTAPQATPPIGGSVEVLPPPATNPAAEPTPPNVAVVPPPGPIMPPVGPTIAPPSPTTTVVPVLTPEQRRTGLLGIRAVRITPELQRAMNLPEPRGALVVEVRPGSPAQLAGIPVDAVIVAAAGRTIGTPDDLAGIVRSLGDGAELRLTYFRYGQSYERVVKLERPEPTVVEVPAAPTLEGPQLTPPATPPVPVVPAAPMPAAGQPGEGPRPASVEIEQLRRRIEELERRLKEAEAAAKKAIDAKGK